jgi:hypothetical protein
MLEDAAGLSDVVFVTDVGALVAGGRRALGLAFEGWWSRSRYISAMCATRSGPAASRLSVAPIKSSIWGVGTSKATDSAHAAALLSPSG